jgi:glycosyltransferase involved in cell wall biosynthesis
MHVTRVPKVWFPTVRAGSGTDIFTMRLVERLHERGLQAKITWLPLRAEYAPWSVIVPQPPEWANIVHVNTWLHPRFHPKNLPIVATLHHSVHHPELERYKGRLRAAYHNYWIKPVERSTLQRAERVIAVSQFAAEAARETLLDIPMQVIHNGVDIDKVQAKRKQAQQHPYRLLYVGNWASRKGVDLLAPILRELGNEFELLYTGNTAGSVKGNMRDIGRLTGSGAVAAVMQDADALLFPSRSEGFPLVVIEAMANGLPVITTKDSSMPEAIEDGVSGILCPQDDVDAFVDACRRLAADPMLQQKMSDAARTKAKRVFSLDLMADTYISIYQSCIDGHKSNQDGRES